MIRSTLRQSASHTINQALAKAFAIIGLSIMAIMMMSIAIPAFAQQAPATGGSGFISDSDNIPLVSQATGGAGDARSLILKVLNNVLTYLGVICVIMVIYGGFMYVTSAGEEDKAKKGRTIIMYAGIGIIIILVSFALVRTVFTLAG